MRQLFLLPFFVLCACNAPSSDLSVLPHSTHEVRDDLKRLYDSLGVTGSFILHDAARDHWVYVDSTEAGVATLPASTYKILGTLIALETGVAIDANTVLPWDSVRRRPDVDHDLSLFDAYHHSAYWFHRNVARRIGANKLKRIWDEVGYGNADTTGGFDKAWVAGNLLITPHEQIRFLERLYRNDLPFTQRTMDITKAIMVQNDTLGYLLRAKTGWAQTDSLDLGWYVGWVEHNDATGPYFFATRLRCTDSTNTAFGPARINTSHAILSELGILPR
ncbi:MAG: class D beta-lactamase [Flavobacteriales bacterium]|nr:class D beta-lactamase [Flavobacteriales bacterium]